MGEIVTYHSNGGTSEGYLALPATADGAASPAVIVIQEWWGLVPHIVSVADRFASEGFVALVPDFYRGVHTSEPDDAGKLLMGLAMEQAGRDIAGAASYLAQRPDVAGKVGAVGFRAGGSLALWSATLSDEITAAVGFYPVLPWERMTPDWSDYAGKTAVIHCSAARGTSAAEGTQTARRAIEKAGGECVLHDYPGTRDGFFNDDRPEVYDRSASSSAWARTLELFRTRLG